MTQTTRRATSSSYTFHPVFEAKSSKAFTEVFKGMVQEDAQTATFVKKLEHAVHKVAKDSKKDQSLINAFASRCEDKDLRLAFNFFDVDQDGYLNREEIRNALKALGEDDVDIPKSMKLSFKGFKQLMK